MYETPTKEPPVKADPPEQDEPNFVPDGPPMYKCALCPFTDEDPDTLCEPIRIA